MKQMTVLIKPASSLCNLRCAYCFYADVSENREIASTGIMSEAVLEKVIQRIAEALDGNGKANINFQGGEPTVAGLDYFKRFVTLMDQYEKVEPHYSIQTNATLLDEEWIEFFRQHHFLVGVSLDGFQSHHDAFRYDAKKKGVHYKVMQNIEKMRKAQVDFNILTVVTRQLAQKPKALFQFYRQHHFDYVQLIPCLPDLEPKEDNLSLTPQLYANFYLEFYKLWYQEALSGQLMNVNLFTNLATMLQGMPPYQCGLIGQCFLQYVIEANGDVYPCDFYCLDEYCMGNLNDFSFEELSNSHQAQQFLQTSSCTKSLCQTCPFEKMCHGGCRRQNVCYLTNDFCAYQEILKEILPSLAHLLQRLQQAQS